MVTIRFDVIESFTIPNVWLIFILLWISKSSFPLWDCNLYARSVPALNKANYAGRLARKWKCSHQVSRLYAGPNENESICVWRHEDALYAVGFAGPAAAYNPMHAVILNCWKSRHPHNRVNLQLHIHDKTSQDALSFRFVVGLRCNPRINGANIRWFQNIFEILLELNFSIWELS